MALRLDMALKPIDLSCWKLSRQVRHCSHYARNQPNISTFSWKMSWRTGFLCYIIPWLKWNGGIGKVQLWLDMELNNKLVYFDGNNHGRSGTVHIMHGINLLFLQSVGK